MSCVCMYAQCILCMRWSNVIRDMHVPIFIFQTTVTVLAYTHTIYEKHITSLQPHFRCSAIRDKRKQQQQKHQHEHGDMK